MAKSKPTKMLAVLGRCRRGGRWQPASRSSVLAVFGDCHLDMRKALVDAEQPVRFEVTVFLGSVTFIVPPGVEIRPSGMSILASSRVAVPTAEDSSFPVIEVEWNCILGRIRIISMDELGQELEPGDSAAEAAGLDGTMLSPTVATASPSNQIIAESDPAQPVDIAAEPAVAAGLGFEQEISNDVPDDTTDSSGSASSDETATIGGPVIARTAVTGIPSKELGFVDQVAA